MLRPFDKESLKNSETKDAKSSCLTLKGKYSILIFVSLENLEWIKGDSECSIGSPTTPNLYNLDIPILVNC